MFLRNVKTFELEAMTHNYGPIIISRVCSPSLCDQALERHMLISYCYYGSNNTSHVGLVVVRTQLNQQSQIITYSHCTVVWGVRISAKITPMRPGMFSQRSFSTCSQSMSQKVLFERHRSRHNLPPSHELQRWERAPSRSSINEFSSWRTSCAGSRISYLIGVGNINSDGVVR